MNRACYVLQQTNCSICSGKFLKTQLSPASWFLVRNLVPAKDFVKADGDAGEQGRLLYITK